MSLRGRVSRSGQAVSPWAWGWEMGLGLCDLLGRPRELQVVGALPAPNTGLLLLSAHLGPWEAGAVELARRGHRPMVLASPWKRLPRSARSLAERRESQGIATAFRGRAGWRAATRHLRDGGTVVALIDSLSPRRPGRRALDFVEGKIGAPDALLAWADRQGAEVRLALGQPNGFVIERLEEHQFYSSEAAGAPLRDRSDRCVERLQEAVRSNPSSWAWVRALAVLAIGLPGLSLSACDRPELVPPLPRDPADWITEAEGLEWSGEMDLGFRGHLRAGRALGEWKEGKPHLQLTDVDMDLFSVDTGLLMASLEAATAQGSWPDGPTSFKEVTWRLPLTDEAGSLTELHWQEGEGWHCGGCPLEGLVP